ncbi:PREDICTED: tetratricopeptide repeat protein 8-like [Galeopterus variegatus]|uniref:Tetratricopeptide repeat protein 8-like n=1 Tax=Galeopterus variegatus TaxID=482537 RepID=A0ABM0SET6_GALVR|nr:PREDICTED: tetratricopeptide repeat protein 8-like [Galeopterus variegatus]
MGEDAILDGMEDKIHLEDIIQHLGIYIILLRNGNHIEKNRNDSLPY